MSKIEKTELVETTAIKNVTAELVKAPAPAVTESYMLELQRSTKALLDAQPKMQLRLPAAKKGEPNYEIVGVNGYNYQIKRGESVQVPETVFNILVEAGII